MKRFTRQCIACRKRDDKEVFFRLCYNNDSVVVIKQGDYPTGRSAYLCRDEKCISVLYKSAALERALRRKNIFANPLALELVKHKLIKFLEN